MTSSTKRPPLTALLREQTKPLTLEEQQRIQAENDQKLYGTRLEGPVAPSIQPVVALPNQPLAAPIKVGEEIVELNDEDWVAFASYLKRRTYMLLKQAEFWEPGFNIRHYLDASLRQALEAMPNANRPLPPADLDKLLKTNRKLQPKRV
jgi:hypothetical protein